MSWVTRPPRGMPAAAPRRNFDTVTAAPERGTRERSAVVDATMELAATHAYARLTVAEIAAAAGMAPSDFFRYFPGKDAVVLSVLQDLLAAAAAHLPTIVHDDPRHALHAANGGDVAGRHRGPWHGLDGEPHRHGGSGDRVRSATAAGFRAATAGDGPRLGPSPASRAHRPTGPRPRGGVVGGRRGFLSRRPRPIRFERRFPVES